MSYSGSWTRVEPGSDPHFGLDLNVIQGNFQRAGQLQVMDTARAKPALNIDECAREQAVGGISHTKKSESDVCNVRT